jgi:hypothetical protein
MNIDYQHLLLIACAVAKWGLQSPRCSSASRLHALEMMETWVNDGLITRAQLQAVEAISVIGLEMVTAARALDPKPWPKDNFSLPPSLRILDESWEHLCAVSPSLATADALGERRETHRVH